MSSTVIHRFNESCAKSPNANALYCENKFYTYHQLAEIVSAIRILLPKADEQLIGVVTGDDVYTYASILAILSVGAGYVPINHKNPKERNATIIEEAGLKTIISKLKF